MDAGRWHVHESAAEIEPRVAVEVTRVIVFGIAPPGGGLNDDIVIVAIRAASAPNPRVDAGRVHVRIHAVEGAVGERIHKLTGIVACVTWCAVVVRNGRHERRVGLKSEVDVVRVEREVPGRAEEAARRIRAVDPAVADKALRAGVLIRTLHAVDGKRGGRVRDECEHGNDDETCGKKERTHMRNLSMLKSTSLMQLTQHTLHTCCMILTTKRRVRKHVCFHS